MKRAYDICRKVSAIGLLPLLLFLRFSDSSRQTSILWGFLLLPFTLLTAASALLNHFLPPEQQEEIQVDWRFRITHPYWDLFLIAFLNLLCFLSALEPFPHSDTLIWVLAFLAFFAQLWGIGYAHWKKRHTKTARQRHRKEK